MKTKIKRHSRSALSILLTICMLVSCMTVGLIATDAAKLQSEAVGLDSGDGMYLGIGSADNMQWYGMGSNEKELVLDSAKTIYFHFYVGGSKFAMGSTSTQPSEACTEDWTLYAQKNASNNISASLPAGTYKFKLKGVQSNNTNCLEYQFWKVSGGNPTPSGEASGVAVTDDDLKAVLKGTKIMIYFGDEWGSGTKYAKTSTSGAEDVTKDSSISGKYNGSNNTQYLAYGAVTAGATYSVSNSSGWGGVPIGTPAAGYMYALYSADNQNYYWTNTKTPTISWTTSTDTVKSTDTTCDILATSSGQTGIDATTTVKYFYTTDNTNFYTFNPNNLSGMNLAPGTTYTIIATAFDENIYVKAATNGTLTVTTPTAASLSISADPDTLSAEGDSSTITVIATDLAYTTGQLKYTLYKADGTQVDTKTVAANTITDTFTVTPNARSTGYYATVEPATTGTLYDPVNSNSVTVSNTDEKYIPKYTVTFDSNNANYGTVTAKDGNGNDIASGTKVKEGDSVTFTATPKAGNVFTSWSAFDTTATSVTRVIRADTTVRGNFGPKGYQIIAGSNDGVAMRELANGTYISVNSYSDGNWFQIVRNSDSKSSVGNNADDSNHCQFIEDSDKHAVTSWRDRPSSWNYIGSYANKTGGARYVVYNPSTDEVWLTADKDDLYTVRVIAKDGTLRYGYTNHSNYAHSYGNTTLTATDAEGGTYTGTDDYDFKYDNDNTTYYAAEKIEFNADAVRKGITLKVQTQVNNDKLSEGYYVKGFVVSGYEESFSVLWQDDEADLADINRGYNEFTLTLPAYPAKDIEITPVYWIKETEDNKTVRFYVDGFAGDVYKEWDGNLAIQAFKKNGTPVLGEYPGQPMINYNGRYVVDIPREDLGGITLNNYVWDRVHSNLFYGTTGIANPDTNNGYLQKIQAANKQTYDFNDFIYIKEGLETDTDTDNDDEDIIFSFRYKYDENHNTVATSNHGQMTYYKDSDAAGKDPVVTVDTNYDYENQCSTLDPTDNIYQWEELTDFYHNRVDILGNYVDLKDTEGTITNPKAAYTNPVRIVSNGYDFNEAGKYATAWAVYVPVDANDNLAPTGSYHHYKLIEVFGGQGKVKQEEGNWIGKWGSSSYLVNPKWRRNLEDKYDWEHHQQHVQEGTETVANFIYDLANMPTVISYEYSIRYNKSNLNLEQAGNQATDGNPGLRSDGRWYASKSDQLLTAHTIIEYAEKDEESLYQRDFYQAGGIDYNSESGYDPSKNTGIATGIQAYFENSNSDTLENVSFQNHSGETRAYSISDGEEKHNFLLKTVGDANGEYAFKGWYLYTNGKYSWVSSDPTYSSEATANDVYVARYYKVPSGTLNVTHNLHPDSTGTADCYAKVEVMNGNNVVYTYAETTDAIKVTSAHMKSSSTNTLRITLRTVPDNKSPFEGFYKKLSATIEPLSAAGVLANVTVTSNEAIIETTQIKDFFDDTGAQTIKALPFYSKLGMFTYSITYHYTSYRGNYGTQTYKVTGQFSAETMDKMEMGTLPEYNNQHNSVDAYVFKNGSDRTAFLNSIAPYENDWMKKFTWNTTYDGSNKITASYSVESRNYVVDVYSNEPNAAKCDLVFRFPYDVKNASLEPDPSIAVPTKLPAVIERLQTGIDYNTWYTTNGVKAYPTTEGGTQPDFITAPAKIKNGDTDEYFRYWSVKSSPTDNHYLAVEYTRCYSREFNLVAFQNLIIEPVYTPLANGEAIPNPYSEAKKQAVGATISFIENSRNQWNNDGGGKIKQSRHLQGDRIYTDFLLSVATDDNRYLNQYAAGTYKVGLIIERVAELDKDNDNNYVVSTESEYKAKYDNQLNDNAHRAMLNDYIQNSTDGTNSKKDDNQVVILQGDQFDATELDNKNRIEYYYSMSVRSHSGEFVDNGNKNYVYRAYSYLKKTDGNVVEYISTPVYFTIYDMASIANAADGETYDSTIGR